MLSADIDDQKISYVLKDNDNATSDLFHFSVEDNGKMFFGTLLKWSESAVGCTTGKAVIEGTQDASLSVSDWWATEKRFCRDWRSTKPMCLGHFLFFTEACLSAAYRGGKGTVKHNAPHIVQILEFTESVCTSVCLQVPVIKSFCICVYSLNRHYRMLTGKELPIWPVSLYFHVAVFTS